MSKARRSRYYAGFVYSRDDMFEEAIAKIEEIHDDLDMSGDEDQRNRASRIDEWLVAQGYWNPRA